MERILAFYTPKRDSDIYSLLYNVKTQNVKDRIQVKAV